jgi:predicted nucleic acid-binding protein
VITYFVDTSGWYDLISSGSPLHEQVSTILREPEHVFITTTHVLAELTALLLARSGHSIAAKAGTWLRAAPEVRVIHAESAVERAGWRLFLERADKTYTLTDCVSFVVMRALKLDTAIATDDHFRQEGFRTLP